MNKRRVFIIMLILLLIVLAALIILLNSLKNQKNDEKYYNKEFEDMIRKRYNIQTLDEDITLPKNPYKFFTEIETDADAKKIYENLDYFFKTVVNKYIKEIKSDKDIEDYFDDNEDDIYLETGIQDYEKFYDLVSEIIEISDGKTLKLEELNFGEEYIHEKDSTNVSIEAKYDDNIVLNCNLIVYNSYKSNGVFIEYNILEE